MSVEAYIQHITNHSYQVCRKLFSGDFTQIVKQNYDGTDVSLQHSFYSIDDDGVVQQLGGLSFSENPGGSVSLNLNVTDSASGETTSVMALSPEGMSVSGGIDVVGGSTNFDTSTINVADFDITLGSGATESSQLDGGGIVLGTPESGTRTLLFSGAINSWSANAGFNVETGESFTINTDSVVLDEAGLKISDILLSQSGLNIGDEVELNSASLTIGETNPVVLNASGLTVGDSLSLSTAAGLQAGDISLDSNNGLVIGTGSTALILDGSGLFVGDSIELSVATGLTLGTINLSTTGLTVGTDLELSQANGLVLSDVILKNEGLTFESATGDVVVNEEGLYVGDTFSMTKTGGLGLGPGLQISDTSIIFGTSPDETVLDDQSLKLGEDVLLNHDGLYFSNADAAIYM
ncbi:unnamed protein product [Sphacelaria rigidula]